jgi:hypothetical protein
MEYDNESTYIVGSRRNILALRRLFDQLGAGERALDIAKTIDSHYITYDELMRNPDRLAMERNTYLSRVEGLNNGRWYIDFRKYMPTPRYVWARPQPIYFGQ